LFRKRGARAFRLARAPPTAVAIELNGHSASGPNITWQCDPVQSSRWSNQTIVLGRTNSFTALSL